MTSLRLVVWRVEGQAASLMAFGHHHDNLELDSSTMASSSPVMHFVYMLRCADASLYIGETDDIEHRIARHQEGRACAYTAKRLPVELVCKEELSNLLAASRREHQLKRWTRRKKEALVAGDLALLKRL
jgi:predicted GIY-YIG superfamily endonuclease